MQDVITSKDNPKVKRLTMLHERKKAAKEKLVFIEGVRLCDDALKSGVKPKLIAVTPDKFDAYKDYSNDGTEIVVLSNECFAKICSTVNPQGVAMIVDEPSTGSQIPYRGDGKDIYVVLEALQDPGNMGTIIRLADAFDFTAVILTDGCVDPYNEKVLRSSMGSLWHLPLIRVPNSQVAIDELSSKGVSTIAADLRGELLDSSAVTLPAAYFIGNEGNGLKPETSASCSTKVKIPMPGKAESLNAASAASIIGFVLSSLR